MQRPNEHNRPNVLVRLVVIGYIEGAFATREHQCCMIINLSGMHTFSVQLFMMLDF